MRRISRLNRSVDLLGASSMRAPSIYPCVTCRNHTNAFSTTTTQKASEGGWFSTENLRKRIWGTDNPPGQKDPYTRLEEQEIQNTVKAKPNSTVKKPTRNLVKQPRRSIIQSLNPEHNYRKPKYLFGMEVVGDSVPELKADQCFTAFIPGTIETDPGVLTVALHRAVVEIFALKQAGKSLSSISKEAPGHELDWTMDATITPTKGGATLGFPENHTLQSILKELESPSSSCTIEEAPVKSKVVDLSEKNRSKNKEKHSKENPSKEKPSEDNPLQNANTNWDILTTEAVIGSWGTAWLEVPIGNPEVKFAIIKRMMQLTGARFPDSAIQSAETVQNLLSHLIKPPKPAKLYEAIAQNSELMNLPNVAVSQTRVTYHDKQRIIGRQKLIRAELMERGLPVFANNGRRVEWKRVPKKNRTQAVSR